MRTGNFETSRVDASSPRAPISVGGGGGGGAPVIMPHVLWRRRFGFDDRWELFRRQKFVQILHEVVRSAGLALHGGDDQVLG